MEEKRIDFNHSSQVSCYGHFVSNILSISCNGWLAPQNTKRTRSHCDSLENNIYPAAQRFWKALNILDVRWMDDERWDNIAQASTLQGF